MYSVVVPTCQPFEPPFLLLLCRPAEVRNAAVAELGEAEGRSLGSPIKVGGRVWGCTNVLLRRQQTEQHGGLCGARVRGQPCMDTEGMMHHQQLHSSCVWAPLDWSGGRLNCMCLWQLLSSPEASLSRTHSNAS